MQYRVTRNTIIGSQMVTEGQVVDLEKTEFVQGLVDDGNLVEVSKKDIEAGHVPVEDPSVQTPAGEGATATQVPFQENGSTVGETPSVAPSDVEKAAELENNPPSTLSTEPISPLNIQ